MSNVAKKRIKMFTISKWGKNMDGANNQLSYFFDVK